MNIDTSKTEEKLTRVKGMLTEIRELSRGINLVVNAGQPLNSKDLKAQDKALTQNAQTTSVKSIQETQKVITKTVGKINAALVSLEKGRQINIGTDAAKSRLQYSKAPSIRNMPFAYMFNAYMMYGMIRKELTEAVEYSNIMAGYDIKSISMGAVVDILASTVLHSNVNIVEMAESFRIAAGYMKLTGVDFTEYKVTLRV